MLATETRGRVVISVLSLALPVLLLWRCAARPEHPPEVATTAAPSRDETPPATPQTSEPASPGASAAAAATATVPATAASLTAPAPAAASSAAAPIIAAVARRDPRDLALLSRIERELKRDPPPAVHALIRMRESGVPRSQLLAEAEKQLPNDVALRVLVRRWLDEVAPVNTAPPKTLGPAAGGGQAPLIKPIERADSP